MLLCCRASMHRRIQTKSFRESGLVNVQALVPGFFMGWSCETLIVKPLCVEKIYWHNVSAVLYYMWWHDVSFLAANVVVNKCFVMKRMAKENAESLQRMIHIEATVIVWWNQCFLIARICKLALSLTRVYFIERLTIKSQALKMKGGENRCRFVKHMLHTMQKFFQSLFWGFPS